MSVFEHPDYHDVEPDPLYQHPGERYKIEIVKKNRYYFASGLEKNVKVIHEICSYIRQQSTSGSAMHCVSGRHFVTSS